MSAFFNSGTNPLNSMLNVGRPRSPFQSLSNSPGLNSTNNPQLKAKRVWGSVGPHTTNPSTPYKPMPKARDYYAYGATDPESLAAKEQFGKDLKEWHRVLAESGRSAFDTPDYQEQMAPVVARNRAFLAKYPGRGSLAGYDQQLEAQRQRRAKDTWLYPTTNTFSPMPDVNT